METMFPIYVFAAVLGCVLLLFSLGFGSDGDADVDVGDADFDADLEADTDAGHGDVAGLFTTFLSLRFWTFFATFFGLAGLVFDGLDILEGRVAPALAASAVGIAAGQVAVRVLRRLAQPAGGEVPEASAYVGKTGRVLLPVTRDGVGKVRIELAGRTVDVLARPAGDADLPAGSRAVIVEMRGETAIVDPFDV
ncbi:MAG: hypothetical protein D6705_02695 [Deltaproteobacteria bacterium]|nr:MAG: hypothetical protein D6705_02695 [Deltaproteobacteria bacterium]